MTQKSGRFWPWFVAALLAATAVGQGIMLYAATHDPTFAVVPDYYERAVAWDSTLAIEEASDALGWHATATLTRDGGARLNVANRLYPTVRDLDAGGLKEDWGTFWR